jgi:hypothetical protein
MVGTVYPFSVGAQLGAVELNNAIAGNLIWNAGTVTSLGSGIIVTSGMIDVEDSIKIRSLPFAFVGTLPNNQRFSVTLTQAGTLLANGGSPQAYIPVNPTAIQSFTLNTISSGTITSHGTIQISTSGIVTFPTFSAVTLIAGDTIQLVNQAVADTTFADACLSLQFKLT